jgi:hypothetical protein
MGWTTEGSEFEPQQGQEFPLLHIIQTGSGVNPTSFPVGIGALSLEVKRPGREADYSPPASAEAKNMWIYTSTPQYAFMAERLVKQRDNFTLPLNDTQQHCVLCDTDMVPVCPVVPFPQSLSCHTGPYSYKCGALCRRGSPDIGKPISTYSITQ